MPGYDLNTYSNYYFCILLKHFIQKGFNAKQYLNN